MEKMTEKNIRRATADSEFFRTLPPANMLHVMIRSIIDTGQVDEKLLTVWYENEDRWGEVTEEERMDQILMVLDQWNPSDVLRYMQKKGFVGFCLPRLMPIRKVMDKKTYYAIIDNFNELKDRNLGFRLNVFLFPFDPAHIRETLEACNMTDDAVNMISWALDHYIDFIHIRNEKKLKQFIRSSSVADYYYMDDLAQAVWEVTHMNEYRRGDSRKAVDALLRAGVPFEADDLEVTDEELQDEAGIGREEEIRAVRELLVDECLFHKLRNSRGNLLEKARSLAGSRKLQQEIRRQA